MGNLTDRILLKNGNVLDVKEEAFKSNLDILIEGDIIKEVDKINPGDESGVKQIDCSRKYVLPGLFECHAHLTVLTNQPEEERKAIQKECGIKQAGEGDDLEKQVLEEFVRRGITQIRDCGGPVKTLRAMRDKILQRQYLGPDLFYAGPMLEKSPLIGAGNNKRWPGFTVAVDSKQDAEKVIEEISGEGAGLVKTFGKFDEDVLKHLLEKAKECNLPVTHDPGPTFFHAVPVDRAVDLGIRCIEHGKSPWYVVLKDDLKSERDRLFSADFQTKEAFVEKVFAMGADSISMPKLQQLTEKMVGHDVYLCPTLRVFRHYADQPEQFNEKEPEKFKKRFEILYEVARLITKEMAKGGIKLLVGTDGWSPLFTWEEMEEFKGVGLSEAEIIKDATIYPAQWLGVQDQFGSISPDQKANILIANKNPLEDIRNIRDVFVVLKGGEIVFRG
jgi:imidazolonepropionase-like amidohydrolase